MPEGRTGQAQTIGPSWQAIFDSDGAAGRPVSTMMVRCLPTSADDVQIRVGGLHGPLTTGCRILAGEREYFRYGTNGIRLVEARSVITIATIDWGPTAST